MPKKFYSQTPVVSAKAIAGKNPIPGPTLGSNVSPTVPQEPGKVHGLGPQGKSFKPGHVKGGEDFTQQQLIDLLDYDPATGIFRWRYTRQGVRGGRVAGCPSGGDRHKNGVYWKIVVGKRPYYAHDLAWFYVYGVWVERLDHKDRNGHNNSIDNLREATVAQNSANTTVRKNNRLGVKGVRKRGNIYEARISKNGKEFVLGYYKSAEVAGIAYLNALKEQHGEFAHA